MQQHERTQPPGDDTHPVAISSGEDSEGEQSPSAFPRVLVHGHEDVTDDCGPFIVYSREFTSARQAVFDTYAAALKHAQWLANSTPGFAYFICSPIAVAMRPEHSSESAAVAALAAESQQQAAVVQ